MPPTTLILAHADHRAGLAVARSAVAAGYAVIPIVTDPAAFACYSKHYRKSIVAPNPALSPEGFVHAVIAAAQSPNVRGIIPITDSALSILNRHRQLLPQHVQLLAAPHDAIDAVLDKERNITIARSCGIPCPRTLEPATIADIPAVVAELGLPVVFKRRVVAAPPAANTTATQNTSAEYPSNFTVEFAHTQEELAVHLARFERDNILPQVQSLVSGNAVNLCCFMAGGELLAIHQYVSLRRDKHTGLLRRVAPLNERCRDYAERMLKAINWQGHASVHFLCDEQTGALNYLETNGRFWASVQGSIHAGWDFPKWSIEYFLHGTVPTPPPLRMGSTTCYHAGDLMMTLQYLKGGMSPRRDKNPGKLAALAATMASYLPPTRSDVFQWSDPMPAIVEHWGLAKRAAGIKPKRQP